ncbi:MAG: hypothetical protein HKM95_18315 [Inquilinus sp.]|nr:hypothetical protein [Inquilinus sp.]
MPVDTCWVITDGKPGMENQCLGLAEALGVEPVVKRVALRSPWRQLSPYFRSFLRQAMAPGSDLIRPPWPDLVISSGRQSIPPALAAKRSSRNRTFVVQIQDPVIGPEHFDMVVVPQHDRARGENVFRAFGSMHQVTPARLAEAAARHRDRLSHLPEPRIAVLIGGDNSVYRLTPALMRDLAAKLAGLVEHNGAGLMITPSRRTGAANEEILRETLAGLPAEIWDGTGENPYFAYLGLADAIIATCDSVNMVSEAASTGKPLHIVHLEGGSTKFTAFHDSMTAAGITRPFTGALESWTYQPPDDTARAAAEIRRRLAARSA